ncbi:MAG: hypothetical protein BSOLF_2935 [Candidatus Carbobacillus altaicus]|uniref:Uncharacterized protein n=1 Tax=Candidatus Carbonibacillus altaicus TaxID=2163959 RepID=A0A2R6XXN5_9BACL|nr:MAG: hypothetical protein BSOLF_2935 [Candidatus Carbobacillus altaicus]
MTKPNASFTSIILLDHVIELGSIINPSLPFQNTGKALR